MCTGNEENEGLEGFGGAKGLGSDGDGETDRFEPSGKPRSEGTPHGAGQVCGPEIEGTGGLQRENGVL